MTIAVEIGSDWTCTSSAKSRDQMAPIPSARRDRCLSPVRRVPFISYNSGWPLASKPLNSTTPLYTVMPVGSRPEVPGTSIALVPFHTHNPSFPLASTPLNSNSLS